MDGANLNAQIGIMQPAEVGADVLHMNLHKTFCIPHGGGGPGIGPIGLKAHLAPFAPGHVVTDMHNASADQTAVAAAAYGSASILPITWMYLTMMGKQGMEQATRWALLNANYVAKRLSEDYPVLYTGKKRPRRARMHRRFAPAQSRKRHHRNRHRQTPDGLRLPRPDRLLSRCRHADDRTDRKREQSRTRPLHRSPEANQAGSVESRERRMAERRQPAGQRPAHRRRRNGEWAHPYSREEAVFPLPFVRENKFWPSVNRVDDVYGDRNLVCSCPPMEAYED